MSRYGLIALDMDGTLLNSEKKISQATQVAIQEVFAAGKEVVLSTGRCVAELDEYFPQLPGIRYLICTSGALVYDLKQQREIYSQKIAPRTVLQILQAGQLEECMEHLLTMDSIVQSDKVSSMERYNLAHHQPMFQRVATKVPYLYAYYLQNPIPVEKAVLHHATEEGRERSRQRLKHLALELVDSEVTSLECSARGVTKGMGLAKLCEYLKFPIEETIAVGDSDNDIDMLKRAGFSIAMGNAKENVKNICDVIVEDCDHDGCVRAIQKYLL